MSQDLLDEARDLLKTARLEAGIACSCSPRRINGEAACVHTQQIDDINTWLASAAEAGDVEARTVEAESVANFKAEFAAWLEEQAGAVRDIGATAALKSAARCLRTGIWRTK